MVTSLRGLGYSLETAIADLVDNSIEAGATKIDVQWRQGNELGPANWVRIVDNGESMTGARATEAFRYGSDIDKSARGPKLSAFGFGLKTASTSQCKKVHIAAKQQTGKGARTSIRLLDIDYIQEHDEWTVLEPTKGEAPGTLLEPLTDMKQGTVVLWQNLDTILSYTDPFTKRNRDAIRKSFNEVADYLGMAFHRFISGTTRVPTKKIVIRMNSRACLPGVRGPT